MKRLAALILALMFVFGLVGCNNRDMNYIIKHEPSVTGTVEEVHDNYMIIYLKTDGYPNGQDARFLWMWRIRTATRMWLSATRLSFTITVKSRRAIRCRLTQSTLSI